jgi:pimeloyl-ACP methyl ester carboxylesterase
LQKLIMGLGGMRTAWQRQTKDFGHTQGDKYSVLVFDNRGIGESGKPMMRYSTSEMARDVLELVDHVGWSAKRDLHVVGISMGGMIAQELVQSTRSGVLNLLSANMARRCLSLIELVACRWCPPPRILRTPRYVTMQLLLTKSKPIKLNKTGLLGEHLQQDNAIVSI